MSTSTTKKKGLSLWLIFHHLMVLIISIGLILVLQVGFIFFVLALLPSLVAYYADHDRKKYVYKTVLACNLAGLMPMFAAFVHSNLSAAHWEVALSEPISWLIAYGSAAGGWCLVWISRAFAASMVDFHCEGQIRNLEATKLKLIEEWGEKVTPDAESTED